MTFRGLINNAPEYNFLQTNPHLGANTILLGLGGSYAYGTNTETSDLDLRGIAINTKKEILLSKDFGTVTDTVTDTTIYSLKKIIPLLTKCNPNTIEILGLKPDHYLQITSVGQELLDNKKMFLSKYARKTFGGYASSQLRKLDFKTQKPLSDDERRLHLLASLKTAKEGWEQKIAGLPAGNFINIMDDENLKKVLVSCNFSNYPLRDFKGILSEMTNILDIYDKLWEEKAEGLGHRNTNAIEHNKLGKHMMHLVRLYYMCFDILEKEEINTFRESEHDLLMSIRKGEFLGPDLLPTSEFFELRDELEKRLDYADRNTGLPEEPDYNKINDFLMTITENIIKGN